MFKKGQLVTYRSLNGTLNRATVICRTADRRFYCIQTVIGYQYARPADLTKVRK